MRLNGFVTPTSARWPPTLPSTSRVRVFVDADVLASPVPRTILYLARPLSDYELVHSLFVETDAERHQKAAHIPGPTCDNGGTGRSFQTLRASTYPDSPTPTTRTSRYWAPRSAARATFVVTANVRHFGAGDLSAYGLSAVHLPALFVVHRDLFGPPTPDATHRPPAIPFRGARDASGVPVTSKTNRPARQACATPAGPTSVRRRSRCGVESNPAPCQRWRQRPAART